MFKKTTGTQKKGNKDRYNRKPEDKDIHLNVVGVPPKNVSVKKTPHMERDNDYHLYKISIDTKKKETTKEKKRRVGPAQSLKTPSKLQQSESQQSSLKSYFESIDRDHPNVNQRMKISPSKSRDYSEDNTSDVCFTLPGEENRNIRIVGQPLQKPGPSSPDRESDDRSLKPKQVGFSDLDTVYGSAPSVESYDDFFYRNTSPEVYQMQKKNTEDPFLKDKMKISNVFPEWTPEIGDDNISKHKIPEATVKYNDDPHSNIYPTEPVTQPSRTEENSTPNVYKSLESLKSSNEPAMPSIKSLPVDEQEEPLGDTALISNISRTGSSKSQNKSVAEPSHTGLWRGKPLFEGSIGSSSLNVIASKDHNMSPSKLSKVQSVKSNYQPVSGQDIQQEGSSTDEHPDSREKNIIPKSSKPPSVTSTTQAFSAQDPALSKRPSEGFVTPSTTPNVPQYYSISEDPEHLVSVESYKTPISSTVQDVSLPPDQDLVNSKNPVEKLSTPTRKETKSFLDSSTSPRDSERVVPVKQYLSPLNAKSASGPFSTQELSRRSNDRTTETLDPLTSLNFSSSSQKDLKDLPFPEQIIPQKTGGEYNYQTPLKKHKEGDASHVGTSTRTSITDEDSRKMPNKDSMPKQQYNSLNILNSPKETFSAKLDNLKLEETPNYTVTLNPSERPQTRSNTTSVTVRQSELPDVSNQKSLPRAKTIDREVMTEKVSDLSKASIPKARSKLSRLPSIIQKKSSKESDKYKTSSNETKPSIKKTSVVSSIPKPMRLIQNQKTNKQGKRDEQAEVSQMTPLNSERKDYPVWSGLKDSNQSHVSNREKRSDHSDFLKKEAPGITSSYQRSRPENEDEENVHSFQAKKYLPTGLSNDPSIEISSKTYGEEASGVSEKGVKTLTNAQSPTHGTHYDDKLEEFLDKLGNRSRQQMGSIYFSNVPSALNKSTLSDVQPSRKDGGTSEIEAGTVTKEPNQSPPNKYPQSFGISTPDEKFSKKSLGSERLFRSGDRKQKGETFMKSMPFIETIKEEEAPDEEEQYPRGQRIQFPEVNETRLQNVPSKGEISLVNNEDGKYEPGYNQINKHEILAYPGRVDGQTPFAYDSKPGEGEQNNNLSAPETFSVSFPLEKKQSNVPSLTTDKMATEPQKSTIDQSFGNNDTTEQTGMDSRYLDNHENYLDQYSPGSTAVFQDKWPNVSDNAVNVKKDEQLDKNAEPIKLNHKRKRQDKGLGRQYGKTDNADVNNETKSKQLPSFSQDHNIFGIGPKEQMIYVGRVPNTTYNVFFSPETPDMERSSTTQEEDHKRKSRKHSKLPSAKKSSKFPFATPKGMIIFVNKKQDSNYDPFKEATGSIKKTSKPETGYSSGKSHKRTGHSLGSDNFPRKFRGEGKHYSKDTTDNLEQHMEISPGFAQAGGDKKVMVERSPSGNKITQRYPCGCLRVITRDGDNELQSEELISAFCTEGSKCEVSHPELQKYNRVIRLRQSTKKDVLIPEIEVIADGIISRKAIEPKPPAPTMKGATFTGSLNIKSNKFNGVCNFYFDPRLKQYLRNNIDEFKSFLEDDENVKHS